MDTLTFIVFLAFPCLLGVGLRVFFRKISAADDRVRWARLVIGNLLILAFLLSILLLAGEISCRFFVDTTDSLAFTKISKRWVRRHWHTNISGLRDNIEYIPAIQPDKRRVIFLGDSFAAGHGIKNVEDRFPNRLRAQHKDWEVYVLANVGMDTAAETALLKKALSEGYQVNEVVLVYCLNDVGDLLMAPGQPFASSLPKNNPPWFVRGSYFLDTCYYRCKAARNPFVRDYYSFVKAGYTGIYWEIQQKRLKRLLDIVQSHGARLSVVTFPFLNAIGPKYEYGFIHEELDRFWKGLNVAHVDLLSTYTNYKSSELTVNSHDAHPNEKAHQLAADAINRELWPVLADRVQTNEDKEVHPRRSVHEGDASQK